MKAFLVKRNVEVTDLTNHKNNQDTSQIINLEDEEKEEERVKEKINGNETRNLKEIVEDHDLDEVEEEDVDDMDSEDNIKKNALRLLKDGNQRLTKKSQKGKKKNPQKKKNISSIPTFFQKKKENVDLESPVAIEIENEDVESGSPQEGNESLSRPRRACERKPISYQEIDEDELSDDFDVVDSNSRKRSNQRVSFLVAGVVYRELSQLVKSPVFKRLKIPSEPEDAYELENSDEEFEAKNTTSKNSKKPHKFFMTKEQKAQLRVQETLQKFQEELNRSRQASVDFFTSKQTTINPFFTNVSASIKAVSSENINHTIVHHKIDAREEYDHFPLRQHIGSDATPCKGVLRYRALTEFSEPIFESFFSYSVQSQESRFVAPLFACFRQPLNVMTMRQLWIEYVLQKTPSLLIQTVPEKNVPVIDLVPSKEVIDLDPPSVTKDKLLPLNWNLLENSLSNLLLELHHQSIAFPEEKSYCRDSIKSAQTQIVNWLQHWKSRSEVERKSTSSTKKRKSRSSNSDSDDEFVESDELNDLDIREYNTKLLILSGRSGISKSCLVHACATICGYTIIEVNSGHERCGANIKKLVAEAAQSQTIKTHDTSSSTSSIEGFNLIFFDEVDVIFKTDQSFLTSISQLLQTAKCPVILTTEMSNISQLQYFKNIDPPPLQINISPPDHVMLGHVLFELVKTNQFLNGVISLQDVIDLAYVTQGDIRASFATLSLLGPRMSHPSFKVTNISTKNTSFVKWAKCQGYWGDALDVIEGIGMRSEDQPLVIELTTASNAIINMTSSVSQVEKLESNQINQSEEYDFSLHCPIITFIEPKVIDRFIGGAIRIFGCNFLQKTPNSPNIIPLLVVLDGFGEFEPIIYSDSEIGLTLPPYKTDDIQLPTRIPTVTFRVTVKITSAYGCLSSNLCDINPFWVAFADSRIPQERSSSTSIPLLPEPNSGKQVVAPKSRINRKTVETSVESDDDDFEMDDVPKATSSVVRSKRCIIEDEDDDEDDGESPVTQSESCSENMNIIPSQLDIYDMMKRSLNDLKSHPLILPFLTPLDPLEYQDFYEIISVSMDLGTIESSISENLYHTFEEYINDVKLMFTNQLLYHEKGKDSNCLHQLQELLQSAKILEKYFHENIQIILSNPSYQTTSSCTEIQCNFSVSKPLILPSPPTSNDLARMESIAEKERKSLPLLLPFLESIPRRTFTLNFHNKSDVSHDDLHDIEALCEYCDITSDQDCLYGYLESHCDYYQSSLYDNLRLIDNEMMIINGSKLISDDNFIDEDDDEEDMELSWWDYSKTINMIPGNEIFIIPSNLLINIRYSSRLLTSLSLIKLDKIRYQKYLILFKSLLNIPLSSRSLTNSFNYYLHKSSIICDILPWILSLCKLQQGITSTSRDMIPTTSMNTALHEDPYHTSSTSTTINRRSSRLSLKLFPSIQKYQRIRNLLHLSEEEVELLLTTFSFS